MTPRILATALWVVTLVIVLSAAAAMDGPFSVAL